MFALYLCFFILYIPWLGLVITTFFAYITPGLKRLYWIFLLHFLFSSIYVFLMVFRPGWNGNVVNKTYDSKVECYIMGFSLNFVVLVAWFLVTYFNYLKFDFYYALLKTELNLTRFGMRIAMVFYINSAIAFLLVEKHGPDHRHGYNNCGETNIHGRFLYKLCTFLLFLINVVLAYTFVYYRKWRHEAIINIEHQLMVNVYLSPLLFFSTVICTILGILWQKKGMYKNGTYISIHLFEHLVDCFFNNMLMYYYIFELVESVPDSPEKAEELMKKRALSASHLETGVVIGERPFEKIISSGSEKKRTTPRNIIFSRIGVEMSMPVPAEAASCSETKRFDKIQTSDAFAIEIVKSKSAAAADDVPPMNTGHHRMDFTDSHYVANTCEKLTSANTFEKQNTISVSVNTSFEKMTTSASNRFEIGPLYNAENDRDISESSESEDLYTETGLEHDPIFSYQWIALPGGHPILCTRALIIAHGLHKFIVTKPDELHLIHLYQRRGHITNLMQFCNSSDQLSSSLNAMGFRIPTTTTQQPSWNTQKSVDMSMFYE